MIPAEDTVLLVCDALSDDGCPVFQKIVPSSSGVRLCSDCQCMRPP